MLVDDREIAELKDAAAKAVGDGYWWEKDFWMSGHPATDEEAAFIALASPRVVSYLIEQTETQEPPDLDGYDMDTGSYKAAGHYYASCVGDDDE